ncbi:hypothetical protein KVH22_29975 [Streptomyces olivaceus]|uniref:hypothetical protein n=1 Tax=Streptomyces olivaceus TaxID=47716 RepID=UPI001CCDFB09|nr:hypothetical protein [Streptomyces olivaceus]MBZ6259748.1 hypothetical protein [Streptomyces olivaceus]
MSDDGRDRTAWHRARAQYQAFNWADRATAEYGQAVQHEDQARARQQSDNAWQRDRMAEERRLAQFHGVRSTEALKLAEMWARVAHALSDEPPLLPEPASNHASTQREFEQDAARPRGHNG